MGAERAWDRVTRFSLAPCYARAVGRVATSRTLAICTPLLVFAALDARVHADPAAPNGGTAPALRGGASWTVVPTAVPAGRIQSAPPAGPDPRASYVFYLHGRIVEQQGANAVSPELGRYEYGAILEALARAGHEVISELRPATTAVPAYARKLVAQIRHLLAAGVPATSVTVIGASKGGAIALRVSQMLATPRIGYVLLGSCGAGPAAGKLHGDVLSIYEHSDSVGRSCNAWFRASPELGPHRELELNTGLHHGFLYRPITEWIGPALAWTDATTRGL